MPPEHPWPLDETPWPSGAALAYGEVVTLTTPDPPQPELGAIGPELLGMRGVVTSCEIRPDGPVYSVETDDGSPWRLRPEFLAGTGQLHPGMTPRHRSDLPDGTRVRITAGGLIGEVTGIWHESALEPPKGYVVEVDEETHCVLPDEIEIL
ncbi:hypothetical protein [Kitasatospora sp. NPDC101183]|uniref:hypothetical protein n=1 Tax=Kitasatospora sp. NPDC101183 TaxID=3364100 RepID=UPI0038084378